ncbi:MAG: RnfABCDGE type electron transport complex subunit G [Lachnospiraceae bacterium]|nr:RnfABCDGE type electron transport complex subunit G [Lachnospiraceae bacterium]
MSRIVSDTIKIFAITLVAGLLLGGVYTITKEPIAKAEDAAKQEAYKSVFKDADSFEAVDFDEKQAASVLKEGGYTDDTIDEVVVAKDKAGEEMGYVLTITSSAGYGGDIQFSIGLMKDGTLNGYSILSISETAGLGMKAKEEKFSSQFVNKQVEKFEVTKTGSTSDSEIDAISGATITSKAMTYGVDSGLYYFQNVLMEGGAE